MIPSVLVNGLCRGLRILIIAQHDVEAFGQNLTGNILWIGRINLHLHVQGCTSTRAGYELMPVCIANDGSAFGGTIAHGIGEGDSFQELFYFLIEGRATNDHFVHVAAKGLDHFLTYQFAYFF